MFGIYNLNFDPAFGVVERRFCACLGDVVYRVGPLQFGAPVVRQLVAVQPGQLWPEVVPALAVVVVRPVVVAVVVLVLEVLMVGVVADHRSRRLSEAVVAAVRVGVLVL